MLLHVYTYSVLKSAVQTEIAKSIALMYGYTEGELRNWSLTFEVILCTNYIHWLTRLLIPYFNQQNALNKYNRTDHKTPSILGRNLYIFWLEGAILREFIKNKVSYVQHASGTSHH